MSSPLDRYKDRFDASGYAEDEPVGVFVRVEDPDAVWVPEGIFDRLVCIGRAYALHLLPLLGGQEPTTLSRLQVQNLLDELAFVVEIVPADPLVATQAARMDTYLRRVISVDPDAVVTVEGG